MPAANRMTLQVFKGRLGGAKKGWSLLKKKRDALKARFQALLKDIVDTKLAVGASLKTASFALAKSHWAMAGDDITSTVVERAKRASITCSLSGDNVAGVSLPTFKMQQRDDKDSSSTTLGLGHGGAVINACRGEYAKAVAMLVHLATLQTHFKTLDEEIKMTSRRVNALEYVLIPRIEFICHHITQEMDEEAREEFFRVKKVVEKKKQKIAREKLAQDLEDAMKEQAKAAKNSAPASIPRELVSEPAKTSSSPKAQPESSGGGFLARLESKIESVAEAVVERVEDVVGMDGEADSAAADGGKKKGKKKGKKDSALDQKDDDIVW
jgi:V-type H+-transporting ATPase subunit D